MIHKSLDDVPLETKVKINVNDNRTWCCDGEQSVIVNIAVVAIGIVLSLGSLV